MFESETDLWRSFIPTYCLSGATESNLLSLESVSIFFTPPNQTFVHTGTIPLGLLQVEQSRLFCHSSYVRCFSICQLCDSQLVYFHATTCSDNADNDESQDDVSLLCLKSALLLMVNFESTGASAKLPSRQFAPSVYCCLRLFLPRCRTWNVLPWIPSSRLGCSDGTEVPSTYVCYQPHLPVLYHLQTFWGFKQHWPCYLHLMHSSL